MAISIDWGTKVISIPRNDLTLLQTTPTEIRQLAINDFRLELKDNEDSAKGMVFLDTHKHNPAVEVGGVVLARVVEIINGFTVTFEDGQYAVNLSGANSNIADVTNVNQVSVRSANSAGLQDLSTLLASSYQGQVVFNQTSGQAGTTTPIGTRATPSNNFTDAIAIAKLQGIRRIQMSSSGTLTTDSDISGFVYAGDNASVDTLTIDAGAQVQDCSFVDLTVEGTLDGNNLFKSCDINNVSYVNGVIKECALYGTVSVGGGGQCNVINSWSGNSGTGASQFVEFDMGGAGNSLSIRNFAGGIIISNYDGEGFISVDMASGTVLVDETCTAGTIGIRGIAYVVDESGENCNVVNQTVDNSLITINEGVKSASLLIPHTKNLH